MPPNPDHLDPSELGTKEYWNTLYTRELSNHASDPSDTGTCWFDDSDAERKTAQFLDTWASSAPLSKATASILDLGCGNGSMLLALRGHGWTGRALGVDYSPQSVALAQQVASASALSAAVEFAEWDIADGSYAGVLDGEQTAGWDVVLDKGTFDAVSLSDQRDPRDPRGRRLCELYPGRVAHLVRKGGIFLVTSCNWTEDELTNWFVGKDGEGGFAVAARVEYRAFSFGGVKGQTISTLCFKRLS